MKTVRPNTGPFLATLVAFVASATISSIRGADIAPVPPNAPFSTNRFYPVPLENFYKHLFSYYKPTDSWGLVPHGLQQFDGVPFRMFGQLELTGLGPARDKNFHPTRVSAIPMAGRTARIHLIHGAAYADPDGTPVAELRINYTNGEMRKLFLRYGVHMRNWYAEVYDKRATLQDPRSLVIWNGNSRADGLGTPTRLFKTTLDNPLPAEPIESLDLLSLFARANSVMLAITTESPLEGANPFPATPADEDDSEFRRETLLRTLDADTGAGLAGVAVDVAVTEGGRSYSFGSYKSNKHGQILFDYPPGKFEELKFRVNDLVNPPAIIAVSNDEGIYGAEIPLRIKRPTPKQTPQAR